MSRAVELDPDDSWAFGQLGVVYLALKQYDQAIDALNRAVEINPNYGWALTNRGVAYARMNQFTMALEDFSRAVEPPIDTTNSQFHVALHCVAWALATLPEDAIRDGRRAIELSTRACELTEWQLATYLDTLAAAYAEAGDFDQAVRIQEQALEMDDPIDEDAHLRLQLYQAKQPYRQA